MAVRAPVARRPPRPTSPGVAITSLTLLTLLVVVVGLVARRGYALALALAAATPVGAAAVVGAVAVPTFYAVSVGALVGLGLRALRQAASVGAPPTPAPATRTLLLLVAVAVLVTLVAPLLFDGLAVSSGGVSSRLAAGVVTKSNAAQVLYLVLSVAVVLFLARARGSGAWVLGLSVGGATVLSFWAWAGTQGAPFPTGFFDNSPFFVLQDTLPGGAPRVRGIFSEPAGLATSCLVMLAYGASRLRQVRGPRRLGLLVVMAMAGYLGSIATSATFFVAAAGLLVLAAVVALGGFTVGRGRASRGAVLAACGVAAAAVWLLPAATGLLSGVVDGKVGTSSYDDRHGADVMAFHILLETFGVGSGLGADRASSFAATMLATVGLVGTILFASAVWILVRASWADASARPAVWALAALLISKVISGPDLNDTSGVLWLSLGTMAASAVRRRTATPSAAPPAAPVGAGRAAPVERATR